LSLELFVSNLGFRRQHPGQISAAWDKISNKMIVPIFQKFNLGDAPLKNIDTEGNPWVNYPTKPGLRLHPFIDFTGALTKQGKDQSFSQSELDYFGFRNDTDLYFANKRDYVLIVMTGGSEAVGYAHTKTIAQNLETILNSKVENKQFKVLNLAMNSYAVPNEINAYVHLAYHLKPEYVITHSGSNDLSNSIQIPEKFKMLGLFYKKDVEKHWLPRLYDSIQMIYVPNLNPEDSLISKSKYFARKNFLVYEKGLDLVSDSYISNINKYKKIVESNHGKFIAGIQPTKHSLERDKPLWLLQENREDVINMLKDMYSDIEQKARELDYIVFNDFGEFDFVDFVHTSDAGSVMSAEIYAKKILEDFK